MTAALITADQLLHLSIPDKRVELVRGVLVVREPAGYRHGRITLELAFQLAHYVKAEGIGQVVVGDAGFQVASRRFPQHRFRDPDTYELHPPRGEHTNPGTTSSPCIESSAHTTASARH